ncbi:MAG TPA: CHASE3 domain-containing protein [Kofleriaceae bacterium]|jgi:methyl-accepting chemotaxis protein
MFRKWTFGRKVGAGFAIAIVALVIVSVVGYRSATLLVANTEHVERTQHVRHEIAELLVQLVNAETGQRGFVITGQDSFLEPYNAALTRIDATYTELRSLLTDEPDQERRLEELRPQIDGKLAELKRVIEERRTAPATATATIAAGEGKEFMDAARRILNDMDDEEVRVLAEGTREVESSTTVTTAVIEWGSLAAIVLTFLVAWLITSSLSKQIGGAVRNMQSSATELQTASNQQASSATEQATAMTEIASTINELMATSRQIAASAQRVAQVAGETAAAARIGKTTVGKGGDASATVRKQVDLIVAHMLDLGKRSQQVGVVLDIVAELAEQTNILAINATIEAAGAGDAGRRFGVVADEIRKLADRVGASTKEIRAMIDDVRSAVNSTVMVTEAGSKAVDAGAVQVAEVATSFTQIASLVAATTDAAREIELSTKQQATAVEQVNVAIANVAQATRETQTSTTQTLQTASQLTSLSSELSQIIQAS